MGLFSSSKDKDEGEKEGVAKRMKEDPTTNGAGHAQSQAPGTSPHVLVGGAESQGYRDHMEDRMVLLPDFGGFVRGTADGSGVPRKSSECEDGGLPRLVLVAVFDGHMGDEASSMASKRLPQILAGHPAIKQAAQSGREGLDGPAVLTETFRQLEEEIVRQARAESKEFGTTAVVVLLVDNHLYAAGTGDSRAVLSEHGKALRLTKDHKISDPVEAQRVTDRGGKIRDRGPYIQVKRQLLNMTRSLGDPMFKEGEQPVVLFEPDVSERDVDPGSGAFLVLGSDGLWDVVEDQEATDLVAAVLKGEKGLADVGGDRSKEGRQGGQTGNKAATAAQALVQKALDQGTKDNIAAIVVALT